MARKHKPNDTADTSDGLGRNSIDRAKLRNMLTTEDFTGRIFTRLLVLGRAPNRQRHGCWLVQCVCGREKFVTTSQLISGKTRSCGCLKKERIITLRKTHGMSGTRTYKSYLDAKSRCENPNNTAFADYGGRGIRFLFAGFQQLYAELGDCPPGMTLGRIDNDGHYAPGNVRWETRLEQNNNSRHNRPIAAFGQTKNLSQWARLFLLNKNALRVRLKLGLSPEHALLDQGRYKTTRIIVTGGASFERRVELLRRMFDHQSMTLAERREARRALFKAVWNEMDAATIRRSQQATSTPLGRAAVERASGGLMPPV